MHCEAGLSEPTVLSFCHSLYMEENCRSPHLLAYLVDLAIEQAEQQEASSSSLVDNAKKVRLVFMYTELCCGRVEGVYFGVTKISQLCSKIS